MTGKTLYDKYRKAHGQVLKASEHPAMYGDRFVDLPEFDDLTDQEQKGWNAAAKTPKKK